MKSYSSAISNYRALGKAFLPVDFISFRVNAIGDPDTLSWVHLCSDDEDMTVSVVDPDTGVSASRTFIGGGHIIGMGDLVRSEGAIVRSHTFVLSGASDVVLDMAQGHDCREAPFQWFIGELDQDTGLLLDVPPCEFVGFVNAIEISDGAIDAETGSASDSFFSVTVDSLGAALMARNYGLRSLDASESRSDDLFYQYAGSAHHWNVRWGKEKKAEKDRKGGGGNGGRDRKPDLPGRPGHT